MKMRSNIIRDIITYIRIELSAIFEKREIENHIAIIFQHFMGFSKADLIMHLEDRISESLLLEIHFVVKDLKKHKPIQYILGVTSFYDITLQLDEHVLIPRPETEELLQWVLHDQQGRADDITILEIGTGSGCIALALKKHLGQKTHVIGLDYKKEIIALAKKNAIANKLDVNFVQFDITAKDTWHKIPAVSLIVSNPPYVTKSDSYHMHQRVLNYEPHEALFAPDDDPLFFYNLISDLARQKLQAGGMLYLEINENHAFPLKKLFEEKGYKEILIKKDLSNKDRMLRCRKDF